MSVGYVEGRCDHCGLPAASAGSGPSFCCTGCRAAYEIVQAAGLDRYYRLRRLEDTSTGTAGLAASTVDEVAYAHYDDPEFLREHALAPGTAELRLRGVHCAACVWLVEQLPRVVEGVVSARLELGTGRLRIGFDPETARLSTIAAFLHRLGYPSHAVDGEADRAGREDTRREIWRLAVAGAVAANVMLIAAALYSGSISSMEPRFVRVFEWISLALVIPSVTYGAAPFHRGAWAGLRMGVLHMDLPISLGLLVGFFASVVAAIWSIGSVYFDSVAILVFLLLLGRLVQRKGQDYALSEVEIFHALVPPTASRRVDAIGPLEPVWKRVPTRTLQPGDVVATAIGERFPVDGTIVSGRSHADFAVLTGESRPIALGPDTEVFAGTTNLDAPVEIRVSAVGSGSRMGRLVETLRSTGAARPESVRIADRVAGHFVAAVIVLAVFGGSAWWWIAPEKVFDVVVSLLVISCPCALGLATPLALAVGRGDAMRAGLVVPDPRALEAAAQTRQVLLDKTGTLTEGRMRVVVVYGDRSLLATVEPAIFALERASQHPIARAMRTWCENSDREIDVVEREETPGSGIQGYVGGRRIRIGRSGYVDPGTFGDAVNAVASAGRSPVLVEIDGTCVAVFGIGDGLRADTAMAIERMRRLGLELAIRSGDHPLVVERIATQLGIADARGSMTPEDKLAEVRATRRLAMVGDGVNDAPALSAAPLGIAVGGGAEAAVRVADVYVTTPGLEGVATLLEGSRRTLAIVRRNLIFSLLYNLTFAGLALSGHITPLVAAIVMPVSSLTVVLSSVASRPFTGEHAPWSFVKRLRTRIEARLSSTQQHHRRRVAAGESP